jgi:hypothetical protein
MAATLDQFDHPAWKTTAGMLVAYVVILGAIGIVFFLVPFLLFMAL